MEYHWRLPGKVGISTKVSCVPWMLDEGRRGILIENNEQKALEKIIEVINTGNLPALSLASQQWSENYTLDVKRREKNKEQQFSLFLEDFGEHVFSEKKNLKSFKKYLNLRANSSHFFLKNFSITH